MIEVRVQAAPIDPGAELARIEAPGVGAVASFTGLVRGDGGLVELFLDHYPAMTETALRALADGAVERWALAGVIIVHRVGAMAPGERIVLVATASPHRAAALEACAYLIDRLKTDAPFWKRERVAGDARWVDAKATDDDAAARWE